MDAMLLPLTAATGNSLSKSLRAKKEALSLLAWGTPSPNNFALDLTPPGAINQHALTCTYVQNVIPNHTGLMTAATSLTSNHRRIQASTFKSHKSK